MGTRALYFPVNPKYEKIEECTCYPDVKSIPGDVDLALIVVNYKLVYPMLEQCAEKGVPFVTIFSSGFAEADEEGREIQRKISELSKSTGMRICGPNCQGGVDLFNSTAAAFSGALDIEPLIPGPIGFVTQSGALGYSIFNLAQESGVGFSYVISTGNEVDLDCTDFLNHMLDDPNTRMVAAYMEGIRNGSKFIQMADKAARLEKPVVILKVGRSSVGKKAASSHTGALAGSDEVYDAVFSRRGSHTSQGYRGIYRYREADDLHLQGAFRDGPRDREHFRRGRGTVRRHGGGLWSESLRTPARNTGSRSGADPAFRLQSQPGRHDCTNPAQR